MDIARYGALTVTKKGDAVMADHATFECKSIRTNTRATRKDRDRKKVERESGLSTQEATLLGRLKSRRMALAREMGKPAYVVFSDATLIDMAARRPQNRQEMLLVSGVGDVKFDRFGADFLQVIKGAA